LTAADDQSAGQSRIAQGHGAPRVQVSVATHDARALRRGRWCIVLAAILWSSSGLFVKAPLFESWPVEQRGVLLAFWRAAFAGVLLLPAVRKPRWDARLVPLCATFAVMNITYLSAMSLTTAANAIWLQSTAPWWVCVVGWLSGESLARRDRIPLVIGGIGLAIILGWQVEGQARTGVLCGLVSGLTYGGVVLSLRALRSHDAVWLVAISHLATALFMAPYIVWLNIWPSWGQLPVLAGFGVLQMALPYVLFARGLRTITSQEATAIGLLEPLLLPFWVYLAWGETPAGVTLIGGAFILAGLVLRYALPLTVPQPESDSSG